MGVLISSHGHDADSRFPASAEQRHSQGARRGGKVYVVAPACVGVQCAAGVDAACCLHR